MEEDDDVVRLRDGAPDAGHYSCPRCGGRARPLSVTTQGPGGVLIHLRCDKCPHEFDAARRTQTLFDKN